MSYTIDIQPDQSLVIVTYHGTVETKELGEAQQSAMMAAYQFDPKPRRVFNIQDIRYAQVSFLDGIVHSKQMMLAPWNASLDDVEIFLIFIGTNRAASSYIEIRQMAPMSKFQITAVNDMDEALALVKRMSTTSK
jgi:hypothetical protein